MKELLISRAQADLCDLTSHDPRHRGIAYLHVTKDYVEATDACILMRVPYDDQDPRDFHDLPGATKGGEEFDEVLVDPEHIKSAFKVATKDKKSPVSVTRYAHLRKEGETYILTTTNLSEVHESKFRPEEERFPKTENVIPKKAEFLFALNARYLEFLAKWTKRHGTGTVFFYFDKEQPHLVLCKVPMKNRERATCVIATMALEALKDEEN